MRAAQKASTTPAEKFRADCIRWMAERNPSLFVTFVFNADISQEGVRRKVEKFHARMDRRLLGRAFERKLVNRSIYIGAIEKPDLNIHAHLLFYMTDEQRETFIEIAQSTWRDLAPAGNLDIQRVTDAEGAAAYVAKALRPETSDRILTPPHLEKLRTIR